MTSAEILTMITMPLLAVVVQLQRLIPELRATRAGVNTLLQYFGLTSSGPSSPASPASSSPSSPAAAMKGQTGG